MKRLQRYVAEFVRIRANCQAWTSPKSGDFGYKLRRSPVVLVALLSLALVAAEPAPPMLLEIGQTLTLRVRQVIPADGLSSGERLLNSLPPLQVGDEFVAEIVTAPGEPVVLVAGSVTDLIPPGRFGKPGRVMLELGQLVDVPHGAASLASWRIEFADQRYLSPRKRRLLATLLALEGLGVGASVGTAFQPLKSGYVGVGAAAGLLIGVAYASLLPGRCGSLEPGDTFRVTVGAVVAQQIPPELPLTLYPAQPPAKEKRKP